MLLFGNSLTGWSWLSGYAPNESVTLRANSVVYLRRYELAISFVSGRQCGAGRPRLALTGAGGPGLSGGRRVHAVQSGSAARRRTMRAVGRRHRIMCPGSPTWRDRPVTCDVMNWQYITFPQTSWDGTTCPPIYLLSALERSTVCLWELYSETRRWIECAERIGPRGLTALVRPESRFPWQSRWWWASFLA